MPPMKKLFFALAPAFIIGCIAVSMPIEVRAEGEGVHPWDSYQRSYRYRISQRHNRTVDRSDPYFMRTETHALHPYYRNNYHTFLDVDSSNVTSFQRELFLSGFPYYRVPDTSTCSNHSYYRPNYRTPPSDFRCIAH